MISRIQRDLFRPSVQPGQDVPRAGADEPGLRVGAFEQTVETSSGSAALCGTLPQTLTARAPLEVFELIIDGMDQPTLAAAAPVCTAWYPRAMSNLYSTIQICDRTSYNMLFKQSRSSLRLKHWLATTRELMIEDAYYHRPHFLHALSLTMGRAMAGVRTLQLRFTRPLRRPDFFRGLSQSESVNSLTLTNCMAPNVSLLSRIICAFPQLTEMTMQNVACYPSRSYATHTGGPHFQPRSESNIRLRRLNISADEGLMKRFLEWLVLSELSTDLGDLTAEPDGDASVQSINEFLRAVGSSLTRYNERSFTCYGHSDLTHNTSLRSLGFPLINIGFRRLLPDDWSRVTDELLGILTTVRSCHLECITIVAWFNVSKATDKDLRSRDVLKGLELRNMHEVANQKYFDMLKDVQIEIHLRGVGHRGYRDPNSIGQRIRAVFRGLLRPWFDRGIVEVSWD